MRVISLLSLLTIFISTSVFAQISDFKKTENSFKVSYTDSTNNTIELSSISVSGLDSTNLYFSKTYNKGDNITPIKHIDYKINISKINSFGYQSETTLKDRIITGGVIGAGCGALIGGVGVNFLGVESRKFDIGVPVVGALGGGLFGALVGGTVGAITGIGADDYHSVDLSKGSNKTKFDSINNLIKAGTNLHKEKE